MEERRVSTVYDDNNTINAPLLHEYMLYDPTDDIRCSKCKFLPVCMGGCARQRLQGLNVCTEHKYILSEFLSKYTEVLLSEST